MPLKRIVPALLFILSFNAAHAHEDPVLEWNEIAFRVLNDLPPPMQMRFGAIVQLAVFEGVNSIDGEYQSLMGIPRAAPGASAPAAAVSAAHRVLRSYFPDRAAEYDAAREKSLARIPDGPGRQAGLAAGEAAAMAVMVSRENDGGEKDESYLPGSTDPGEWQPTRECPPTGGVFLHWQQVKPFVIQRVKSFRSPPPPALHSARYARAYAEVKEKGARNSAQRPADRTTVARFYEALGDAALWNPIARQLAVEARQTLAENAHALALMNVGLHDLTIALLETKYHYRFWRPETAIPAGGTDGNPRTDPDASFLALIPTPCHPSYPSGHAATTGVARELLERIFGMRDHRIVLTHPSMPGVKLEYATLEAVADDIDDARVFGGIHFPFDQSAGREQGRRVGAYVWRHAFQSAKPCDQDR
ncbi:MAG TPA: vanadium-dependent haloperoxidase [Steroidobacteraceae bacterium]